MIYPHTNTDELSQQVNSPSQDIGVGVYDCIIIGAGPGGLSAAIYLGRAHKKALVIYAGPRRTNLAQHIQNYLGFEDISGDELLERGMEQAKKYGIEFMMATVQSIKKIEKKFEITTKAEAYQSKYVIVASGIDDIMPEIDNIYEYMGETFFHCFDCDGYHLSGKNIGIIGNTDSAAKTALAAYQIYTKKITIFTGGENDISEKYKERLNKGGIKIIEKNIKHLNGKDGRIESVVLEDGSLVELEMVLVKLGYSRNDSFLASMDLKRSATGYIEADEYYESSVSGLFVIGPLNTGPDQVSVAVGEGAIAAMHVIDSGFKF